MRQFLLLLALFGAIAVSSPFFWVVWEMNTGAARIGIVHEDGVTQWTQTGPKAHWPEWIPAPPESKLTVANYNEAAPGHPALGMAFVEPRGDAAEIQAAYADRLRDEGWDVQVWRQETSNGGLPPREIRICTVFAVIGERSVSLSLFQGEESQSRLVWQEGQSMSAPIGAAPGLCAS